jgi:hemoglobin-like flavoprotein
MSLDVETLRSSFNLVVERNPEVTMRFYEIFFERYPQVKPLFGKRNAQEVQSKMLTQALVAVLDHIEDSPWLEQQLKALGAKHVSYGVQDEMYGWVGECLLAAMAEVAGADWSPKIEQAWVAAYGAIASLAIAGAEEQRKQMSPRATSIPPSSGAIGG